MSISTSSFKKIFDSCHVYFIFEFTIILQRSWDIGTDCLSVYGLVGSVPPNSFSIPHLSHVAQAVLTEPHRTDLR